MKDTFPAVRFGNIGDLSPGIDSGNPRFIDSILGHRVEISRYPNVHRYFVSLGFPGRPGKGISGV